MSNDYRAFLEKKRITAESVGFDVDVADLNPKLFDWQREIVAWALKQGRAAMFEDCGLGKTAQQLEWAHQVAKHTGGDVLILAPLAVARQTQREGEKFGIEATVCRSQSDVKPGVNVANYEMLEHFDAAHFTGVVLDESSILKSYSGKTKQQLIELFCRTPYRLACTATPSPNDHMELGNHSEFLGIMASNEMLARWFINDTMNFGTYRVKGHAKDDFWRWVASWSMCISRPSDIGFCDDGFVLPPLTISEFYVESDQTEGAGDALFRNVDLSATGLHKELRLSAPARAVAAADMVNGNDASWIVWCNSNYEADEVRALIPDAVEVRGSDSVTEKERKLMAFTNGESRVIVTKPSIAGFGLNWQHCSNVVFMGLSYSYEQFYQSLRRSYRFGQKNPVNAHVIMAPTESDILKTVRKKQSAHIEMQDSMSRAISEVYTMNRDKLTLSESPSIEKVTGNNYTLYHGDCCEAVREMEDGCVDFQIWSPPFSSLYIYSDAQTDMGNCKGDDEFFEHFDFLIPELYRITRPGRLCAVHCKNLVDYKNSSGRAGLRDFRGEIIRHMENGGWKYHSEVCIWKDPVIEMQRTKAHGLLYKQLRKDSSFSRQGLPDYLVVFRKWADVEESIEVSPVTHTKETFTLDAWQRYASPVWFDIQQTNVLNIQQARADKDEKHICPLQLDVIERAIELWTNPGDVVFSPFGGIGSEPYTALKMGRKTVAVELKREYFDVMHRNCERAVTELTQSTLFGDDELDSPE